MSTEIISAPEAVICANGKVASAEEWCAFIHARKNELAEQFDLLDVSDEKLDAVMADKLQKKDLKDKLSEYGKILEELRDIGKKFITETLEATDALRIVTQIDPRLYTYSTRQDPLSAYTLLAEKLKAKKDAVKAWEDAHKPPAPTHTYALQLEVTDKQWEKIQKELEKMGVTKWRGMSPQTDKAFKALDKLFAEV